MARSRRSYKWVIYQGIIWSAIFAVWYFLRVDDFPDRSASIKITFVKVAVLAVLINITNYLLVPRLLYQQRTILFAVLFISLVLELGILKVFLLTKILQPYFEVPLNVFTDIKERFYDNVLPLFLLAATGAAAKFVIDYLASQQRLAAISKEKAETELQYLKSQLNPHFVFNTLNAIYFQIDKSNTGARETLLQFSELMRYQLYECNEETIPVEKEMEYLEAYIRLQQKRKDENYLTNFHREPAVRSFNIVPLLLIPFVENAFKHISHHPHKANTIDILAEKNKSLFIFTVKNTFDITAKTKEQKAGGIGLDNVRRRLELLYPSNHTLQIGRDVNVFSIRLEIQISKAHEYN